MALRRAFQNMADMGTQIATNGLKQRIGNERDPDSMTGDATNPMAATGFNPEDILNSDPNAPQGAGTQDSGIQQLLQMLQRAGVIPPSNSSGQ